MAENVAEILDENSTYNQDLVSLSRRGIRFLEEVEKAVSSGGQGMSDDDHGRLIAMVADLEKTAEMYSGLPKQDWAKSHPTLYGMDVLPEPQVVENEISNDLCRTIHNVLFVVRNSASSRLSTGLEGFDINRWKRGLTRVRQLLDYAHTAEKLDYQESSPKVPVQPRGKTGA